MLIKKATYKELLDERNSIIITPEGNSMLPLLKGGINAVKISKSNRKLYKYDVILYQRDNEQYVLHRIIKIKNGKYLLCGDNQLVPETNINKNMILGIMDGYFSGDNFIDVNNTEYKKYSKRRVRNRKWRRLASFLKRIFK